MLSESAGCLGLQFKEELMAAMGLNTEEEGSPMAFFRRGYKVSSPPLLLPLCVPGQHAQWPLDQKTRPALLERAALAESQCCIASACVLQTLGIV